MRAKVIVRGPALTRSGYGEHTRFLLRSLRRHPEKFDVFLIPLNWGQTGWVYEDNEERRWMDELIRKTAAFQESGGVYDMSIQVTIPNEWEKLAPYNVGVTAGIETTKVAPVWLEKANLMDKIITISSHSKQIFELTRYENIEQNTSLTCNVPIDIAHYPVKEVEIENLDLDLHYDFNYLAVAQWGPRKNLENTIRWWVEENFDEEVGLIVKTSVKNNSAMDREHTFRNLKQLIDPLRNEDMKCKVYLLHGDLRDEQIRSLYNNPKIKCFVSLSHGEGFGLPIFDAACHGIPVIAPGWSGHCDFLYKPSKNGKPKAMFADVNYDISAVQKFAVWDGVVQKDSMWCYPHEGHYKIRLRQVRKSYKKWKKKAEELKEWILEEFDSDKKHDNFAKLVEYPDSVGDDMDKMFADLMSEA